MPSLQLYDLLLQFPLFQGMSGSDLTQVAGHTRFDFSKHAAGKVIVREGTPCKQMHMLLGGTLLVETWSDDHAYRVIEPLQAPWLLQPEVLFGLTQRYTHTYKAATDVNFVTLDKSEVMRLADQFLVFRLNLLGVYATQSQKQQSRPWRRNPATLTERIVRFFADHSIYPAGPKTFYILMQRLADEVGDSRLDVSRVLNALQNRGLLELYRGRIEVPSLEGLVQGTRDISDR